MVVIALAGVIVGVIVALGVTRYLAPLLFGVASTDPATYGATVAIVVILTVLSSYLPARRIARVDLVATLRTE